jgi:hypothetical protein
MMKKVIFDVDGVLLSEKRYFDVSALVLWEWYYSKGYMNLEDDDVTTAVSERQIVSLRARLWEQDQILTWLKQHGINNNWDMVHAHILVVLWLLLEQYQADGGAVPAWEFKTYGDIRMAGAVVSSLRCTQKLCCAAATAGNSARWSQQGRCLCAARRSYGQDTVSSGQGMG